MSLKNLLSKYEAKLLRIEKEINNAPIMGHAKKARLITQQDFCKEVITDLKKEISLDEKPKKNEENRS